MVNVSTLHAIRAVSPAQDQEALTVPNVMMLMNSDLEQIRQESVSAKQVPSSELMANVLHAIPLASSATLLVRRIVLDVMLVPFLRVENVFVMLEHSMLPLNHSIVINATPHVLPVRLQLMVTA